MHIIKYTGNDHDDHDRDYTSTRRNETRQLTFKIHNYILHDETIPPWTIDKLPYY